MAKPERTYDPSVYTLCESFINDDPALSARPDKVQLIHEFAQDLQRAIEDWIPFIKEELRDRDTQSSN